MKTRTIILIFLILLIAGKINAACHITLSSGTLSPTVCYGIPITNIVFSTDLTDSPTVVGLPDGVTLSWNNTTKVATLSGNPVASGTFNYTISSTETGGCSISGTITVYGQLTKGTVSANQNICYNTQPALISASAPTGGNTPYSYQWETNASGSWVIISSETNLTYQPGLLTATTKYRLTQTSSSGCGTVTSEEITVNVSPLYTAGTISSNESICNGGIPSLITATAPTGGTGPFSYKWESDATGSWAVIDSETNLTYQPPALTNTTKYRLQQTDDNTGCIVSTNEITKSVYAPFVKGSVSASQNICYNTQPSLLSVSAPTGGNTPYSYQWETDASGTWGIIPSETNLSYQPGFLTSTTKYRLIQSSSSGCGSLTSDEITVNVSPLVTAGTISSSESICNGSIPGLVTGTAPSGGTGPYSYKWESDASGSWAVIDFETGLTYQPPALTNNTKYRLKQTDDGTGCFVTTNEVTKTVYAPLVKGTVSVNQTVCNNTPPAIVSVSAPTGGSAPYSYQWQTNASGTWEDIPSANSLTYQPPSLTALTKYHLMQTSSDGCGTVTSSDITITVYDPFTRGSVSSSQIICDGTAPTQLSVSAPAGGNTPYTYQWQSNASGTWQNISGETSLTYLPGTLNATTSYRLNQTSASGCGTVTSNEIIISVNPLPVAINQTPAPLCEDVFGGGSVAGYDLTLLENAITGSASSRTVVWYRSDGSTPVGSPTNETITNGELFRPRVTNSLTSCYKNATATFTVTPKVNLSSVALSGLAHEGAVLTVSYSDPGLCLPENVVQTQIEWYQNSSPSGTGTKFSTVNGNKKTYTLTEDEIGSYIRAGVRLSDGTTPLFSIVYSNWTSVVTGNEVPVVASSSVYITGAKLPSQTLTAHYTYNDAEGDAESGSIYAWYKASTEAGPYTVIPGETGITHVISDLEQGYWFKFSVTPKAGTNNTAPGTLAMMGSGYGPANKKPEAQSVTISGLEEVGHKLQGSFVYYDADGDPRGTCTYRWLKNGVEITGATDDFYYIASTDEGSLISFEVTPVATTGFPLTGTPVTSTQTAPINPLTTDFLNFKDKYCYGEGATIISVKNVPASAYNEQFRCTNPRATLITDPFDPLSVKVNPTEMTPARPTGSKVDSLIFTYTDLLSGLNFRISRPFIIDSVSLKMKLGNVNPAYCIDATSSPITVDGLYPFGGTGTWTDPGNLLSDKVSTGPSHGATINPNRGTAGTTYTISYQYTSPKGCMSEVIDTLVKINGLPNPYFELDSIQNIDGGPITLVPAQAGGTFSGTGISGNQFFPDLAGLGTSYITYSITDRNNCFKSRERPTIVKKAQGTISGLLPKICYEDKTYTISVTGLPVGAVPVKFTNKNNIIAFTPGTTTATYNIVAAGQGSDDIKFYYTDDGVQFWLTTSIFIDKLEKASIRIIDKLEKTTIRDLSPGEKFCDNDGLIELIPDIPDGFFTGSVAGNYLDPSKAIGDTSISYTYTSLLSGCTSSTVVPIYIIRSPQISFVPSDNCIESPDDEIRFVNNTVSEDIVTSWLWTFSELGAAPDSRKEASFLYNTGGLHTLSLSVMTANGCKATKTESIDIGKKPTASFYWKDDCYHPGETLRLYDASVSDLPIIARTWNFDDGSLITSDLNPEVAMQDTGYLKVKYTVNTRHATCRDSIIRYIYLRPTYKISADRFYTEDFESGIAGWVKDDSTTTNNSWTFGTPDRNIINSAASGSKAWYTKYNITNPVEESSSVVSPCFDFTEVQRPMISLKTFKRFDRNRNGAALQYKLEGSKQWKYVGSVGDGILWYNSSVINGSPGGDKIGWTTLNNDPDTKWTESRQNLDELRGKKNVKFRVAYGSDDVLSPDEGIAFDDIMIGERSRIVLLEHFTNNSSAEASTATAIVNNVTAKTTNDIINIQYHTDFPGEDPYFDQNPGEVNARILAYGITKVPFSLIDGGNEPESWAKQIDFRSTALDTNDINRRSLIDPGFGISLNGSVTGGILNIGCSIKALENINSANLVLYLAVTERRNSDFTGANGETSFSNVFRKFLPDAGGITLKNRWNAGEEFAITEQSWIIQKIRNSADIELIAIIQDKLTKKIYQASSVIKPQISVGIENQVKGKAGFSLFPNPAKDRLTLAFEEPLASDTKITIYDTQGSIVRSYKAGSGITVFTIEDPELKGGIYLLRVTTGALDLGYKKLVITSD